MYNYHWCEEEGEYSSLSYVEQRDNRETIRELIDALYKLDDGEEINAEFISEKLFELARTYQISQDWNFNKPLDICRKSLSEEKQNPYMTFCIDMMREKYKEAVNV